MEDKEVTSKACLKPKKQKLQVSDIYTSDEEDKEEKKGTLKPNPVSDMDQLFNGAFVVVSFPVGPNNEKHFVAVVQSDIQPDREVENSKQSKQEPEVKSKDIIYRELEVIYGWIDSLDKPALVTNLKRHNQNPNGTVDGLRRRLKSYLHRKKLASANLFSGDIKTLFPYYVVLDFEATCMEVNPPDFPHEIIEFPAVLVNTEKMAFVDQFQAYVKPIINPVLTPFCKNLTGISQEQVDAAAEFPEVLLQFEQWLIKHKLGTKNKFAMVTDGPWDMGRFLYGQCMLSNIPYPNFGKKWVNLRKCFAIFYKCERLRLQLMLEKLGMEFVGHPHCGLDDATNIAHLLIRMIKDGATVDINERIQLRYKLDPAPNDRPNENTSNSSNQAARDAWPVKSTASDNPFRSHSQALKDKRAAAEAMERLKSQMKRHTIVNETADPAGLHVKAP